MGCTDSKEKQRGISTAALPPEGQYYFDNHGRPRTTPEALEFMQLAQTHPVAKRLFEEWSIYVYTVDGPAGAQMMQASKAAPDTNDDNKKSKGNTSGDGAKGGPKQQGSGGKANKADDLSGVIDAAASDSDDDGTFHDVPQLTQGTNRPARFKCTAGAHQGVSHASVHHVGQRFLDYLSMVMWHKGWSGSFDFQVLGKELTGAIRVIAHGTTDVKADFRFCVCAKYDAESDF